MAVLLLRLMGPMQSWGTQSRFSHRDSDLEPSKSGVIGLLCAALGIPRDELKDIKKLARLKMGIRVDRQGTLKRDYHTAGGTHLKSDQYGVAIASGGKPRTVTSDRFYLSDACFLVALNGELSLLREIQKNGLLPDCDTLADALKDYPFLLPNQKGPPEKLRLEIETDFGQGDRVKLDQPVSFVSANRRFTLRHLKAGEVRVKDLPPAKEESCIYLT